MADTDALKKYLDAGMAFTHMTRAKAEQVVKDLVAAGELQRSQAKGAIDDLLDRSRRNAETLTEQVRKEVDSQLASLGLARKSDVERLEAELAELKGKGGGKGDAGEAPAPKKAPAKKAAPKGGAGKGEAKPESSSAGSARPAPEKPEKPAKKATSGATFKPSSDDGDEDGKEAAASIEPPSKAAPVKKAAQSPAKPAKPAQPAKPVQPAKKATGGDSAPINAELPGRRAKKESEGEGGGGGGKASPAKKTTKKQG